MQPLGTAGGRGATAMRQPTAYKGDIPANLGSANLNLSNRPVTQQGLTGIRTSAQGPRRQVYDRSYYLNQLRQKNMEMASEIQMFKKRIDEVNRDAGIYTQLEKTYQELSKEVLALEGTLADYNLAADRHRSRAKPEDIKSLYTHLKYQNDRYREQLDEMFIERKRQEEEIRELEQELKDMAESANIKLREMDADQRKEYDKMQQEKSVVTADLYRAKAELEELENKVDDQVRKLKMDQNRMRVIDLKEEIGKLEQKKDELEVLMEETQMGVPELMDRLFKKIKDHSATIQELEARSRELRKAVDNNNRKLRDMEAELSGDNQVNEESKQKYEALFAKEQQLDKFIEGFPKMRTREIEDSAQKQQSILQYLDNISQSLNLIKHAPDPVMVEKAQQDLKFRETNKKNSEDTLVLVQNQVQARMQDLDKIKTFKETAPQKIQALKERLETMRSDMAKFSNAEDVKREMFEKRKRIISKTKSLQDEVGEYRRKLADKEEEFRREKSNLSSHAKYPGFIEMEKKISQTQNTIVNWKNFLAEKMQEIDSEPQSKVCRGIATEINNLLCRS